MQASMEGQCRYNPGYESIRGQIWPEFAMANLMPKPVPSWRVEQFDRAKDSRGSRILMYQRSLQDTQH